MAKKMWRGRGGGGTPPPLGYFASPTGSATGAGTYADPWTLKQACLGGYPTNTIQPGDTIWLRGGTYTAPDPAMGAQGHFQCSLNGTAGNFITFRAYPGEHPIIDGNYDPGETGDILDTITIYGKYQRWRQLEVLNSNSERSCLAYQSPPQDRGDGFGLKGRFSEIVNCILHDTGEGMGCWNAGLGGKAYGNLIYHNGFFSPQPENSDVEAAIDISPAGGTAVATSGSSSGVYKPAGGGMSATWTHNNVSGDGLVVVAGSTDKTVGSWTATYNGVSMSQINSETSPWNPGGVAVFYLRSPATGSHDVVVTLPNTERILGCAQSVVNADTSNDPTAAGTWYNVGQWDLPPFTNTVTSASNHLVMDGIYQLNAYVVSPGVYGDNTLVATQGSGTGNPVVYITKGAGAASVDMGWTWTPTTTGHGHGTYFQEAFPWGEIGTGWPGGIYATASDNTVTTGYSADIWQASDVNATIVIEGAGAAGGLYVGTITSLNNGKSIEVSPAPSTTVGPTEAKWGLGKTYKHNIIYDQVGYAFQAYGSSDTGALNCQITENVFIGDSVFYGGLTRYRLHNTVADSNYHWTAGTTLGYHMENTNGFTLSDNYIHNACGAPVAGLTITGNTFLGTTGVDQETYPTNDYSHLDPNPPTTNLVVIQQNEYKDSYDARYGTVVVYNWENLTSVSVDISSIVPNGTAIDIRNAQDYFNDTDKVYSGTYNGGTVSLPMTGLHAAAGLGYTASGPTGQAFNCFIVVAQGKVL